MHKLIRAFNAVRSGEITFKHCFVFFPWSLSSISICTPHAALTVFKDGDFTISISIVIVSIDISTFTYSKAGY